MCEVEKVPNYFCKRVRFEGKKERCCVHNSPRRKKKRDDVTFSFFWKFFRLKGRGKSEKEGQKEGKERKGRRISSKVGTTKTQETNT